MKILIIEDEPGLRDALTASLEKEQFLVEIADDFASGLRKIAGYDYDCILLDIMLPGGDGLRLLREIRALDKNDGVIIISARGALDDKVAGLELGADDYLTKPFHMAELTARIKSLLRRKASDGQTSLELGNISIQPEERKVTIAGTELPLNRKEFDILYYLAVNRNRLVSKSSLAERVWGDHLDDADSYDFIYSQIKNLRKKLKSAGADLEIQAVYGIGYKLVAL